jgi:hypothetical protein
VSTTQLPSLPAGFRFRRINKRAWVFMALQKETWYGWKTISKASVDPIGLTLQQALISTAYDLADAQWGYQ